MTTTFEAYGFDLTIQTAFQLGGYVYDSSYSSLMNQGDAGTNFHKDMFNRWTPTHTDTNIPALGHRVTDQKYCKRQLCGLLLDKGFLFQSA